MSVPRIPLALVALALAALSPAAHAAPAADSLTLAIDRWANAVGGWKRLAAVHGAHLIAHSVVDGVPDTSETWVDPGAYRRERTEGPDHAVEVRRGSRAWTRDWNHKAVALAGRDRADLVTAAYLQALLYAGFSLDSLRATAATWQGADSTGACDVVALHPPGGVPCTLYLDRRTGLPARAVRKPYDHAIALVIAAWREQDGLLVPRELREGREGDSLATATVVDSVEINPVDVPSRFDALRDGPPDWRFAAGRSATGIPFNFENDHIMIACSVDGSKPIWFLLDTGADVTLINQARLAEFGLTTFGASAIGGGGGTTDYAFTRVKSLRIGGVEMLDQRVGVIDCSGLERLYGMPMGGLLGFDFLGRFVTRVDYGTKTLDVFEPGAWTAPGRGEWIPFVLEQGHPHVRATITVPGGPPIAGDFVIDSGAAETANLTSPFVAANQLLTRARRTPAGAPNVTPGSEKQFYTQTSVRGKLDALALGRIRLTDLPVNLQQGKTGAYASASFAGTIGQRILSRFTTTYDYPGGILVLEPNAEFAKPFAPRTTFGAALVAEGVGYTTFRVTGVRKGSPADSLGLRTDDVLTAIDGRPAAAWRLAGVRAALLEDGARHGLDVARKGAAPLHFDFTVRTVSIEN